MVRCYRADLGDVDEPFLDAFTIVTRHPTGEGEGAVPYLPDSFFAFTSLSTVCNIRRFDAIWFAHFSRNQRIQGCPNTYTAKPQNYFHITGAEASADQREGASLYDADWTYVYNTDIARDCNGTTGGCSPTKLRNIRQMVAAHEFAELFQVNECVPWPDKYHDDRNAWCGERGGDCTYQHPEPEPEPGYSTEWCLMRVYTPPPIQDMDMRADGINRLDAYDLRMGDPLCGDGRGAIRRRRDPQ